MPTLPASGRIDCAICHSDMTPSFDRTKTREGDWRLTWNPLGWGATSPEIVVLGFSKGPTQTGALASEVHESIAYKGSRKNVGKIMRHVGLIDCPDTDRLGAIVDGLIADQNGRFHFGSLIRCTVERFDHKHQDWKCSGGGMLDKFLASDFGAKIAENCSNRFLKNLPDSTHLVLMFGLGTKGNYVRSSKKVFETARPNKWRQYNEVAYTDGDLFVVHVEHFASQGRLIPEWLGEVPGNRRYLGRFAQDAVHRALT